MCINNTRTIAVILVCHRRRCTFTRDSLTTWCLSDNCLVYERTNESIEKHLEFSAHDRRRKIKYNKNKTWTITQWGRAEEGSTAIIEKRHNSDCSKMIKVGYINIIMLRNIIAIVRKKNFLSYFKTIRFQTFAYRPKHNNNVVKITKFSQNVISISHKLIIFSTEIITLQKAILQNFNAPIDQVYF